MLMVFLSSTYAIVFFNLLNQEQIKSTYINLWHNKRLFLILSISSCGVTFGGFLVPIYYLPSIHLVSYMSIMSTIGALMIYLYKKNPITFARLFILLANLIIFYLVSHNYYTGEKYLLLIVITLSVAIFGYICVKYSFIFTKHKFNSLQVLSVRFWLMWLISLISIIYNHQLSLISFDIIWKTLLLSCLILILPMYFSQKAIEKIGPDETSVLIGFTPFTTFILEKIFIKDTFNYT